MQVTKILKFREFENRKDYWNTKVSYWISEVGGILFDSEKNSGRNIGELNSVMVLPKKFSKNMTISKKMNDLESEYNNIISLYPWINDLTSGSSIYLKYSKDISQGEAYYTDKHGNLIRRNLKDDNSNIVKKV